MQKQEKLQRYLELSEEVHSLANEISEQATQRLRTEYHTLTLRDRVLIGLAIKMYNSFESLVNDARQVRLEAIHHLKTLVESYIYFHWVGHDTGDTRARLLFARVVDRTLAFFERQDPGYVEDQEYDIWKGAREESTKGLGDEWRKFRGRSLESLAADVGSELKSWYQRAYRWASEPAHINDLTEYMPLPNRPIVLGEAQTSLLWILVGFNFGLQIICNLLKNVSEIYGLGLDEKITMLQAKHAAIRDL